MSFPYIPTALAYERQNTLLEQAQTARQARQAWAHHRAHGARASHGSSFRWMPGRLASARRRLASSQPRSRSEATG
jgi:hypothetical protein